MCLLELRMFKPEGHITFWRTRSGRWCVAQNTLCIFQNVSSSFAPPINRAKADETFWKMRGILCYAPPTATRPPKCYMPFGLEHPRVQVSTLKKSFFRFNFLFGCSVAAHRKGSIGAKHKGRRACLRHAGAYMRCPANAGHFLFLFIYNYISRTFIKPID